MDVERQMGLISLWWRACRVGNWDYADGIWELFWQELES